MLFPLFLILFWWGEIPYVFVLFQAIQPQEMAKYKQLLMSYNIIDSDGKYGYVNVLTMY